MTNLKNKVFVDFIYFLSLRVILYFNFATGDELTYPTLLLTAQYTKVVF